MVHGFPKSMNIGLTIDKKNGMEFSQQYEERIAKNKWEGWGTCLKPAYEPIIVARKPFKGSLTDNVIKNGVGGLNIDECRVGIEGATKKVNIEKCTESNGIYGDGLNGGRSQHIKQGRFPSNVIHDGSEEACSNMPYTKSIKSNRGGARNDGTTVYGKYNEQNNYECGFKDEGSASRYFYCAKASKKDRDEGLDEFEEKTSGQLTERKENSVGITAYAGSRVPKKNTHPTVKPTELMQYLVRLVSPKGATILDPFMRKWKYRQSSNVRKS